MQCLAGCGGGCKQVGILENTERQGRLTEREIYGAYVDKCNDEDVRIIFENVNLTGVNASAPLTFKKTNGKRILTIKDGTTSIIKDSTNNIGDLADRSIIEVKSCPFAINGKGKLLLNKVGNETSGIKANEKLHIIDTTIEVDANKHGIESKKQMYFYGDFKIKNKGYFSPFQGLVV